MTLIAGYIDIASHGGECCGVNHMYEFPDSEDCYSILGRGATFKDKVETILFYMENSVDGTTVEVVLTRGQAKFWERALYRCGFKRVMEFSNPNTSNILRMYLSTNNQVKPTRTKREKK